MTLGRVLRLALMAWGLGHLALGRRVAGAAWLTGEAVALALVVALTLALADTTWYLIPFLAGMGFIGLWALQAVLAYRAARNAQAAAPPAAGRSPAAAAAWLTVPLLVWGTGFWLFGAEAASPAAVLDRFVSAWPEADRVEWQPGLAADPAALTAAADEAMDRLAELCVDGTLAEDCGRSDARLLGDVRLQLTSETDDAASAAVEVVRFEERPARFLGLFDRLELEPVSIERVLELQLATEPAALGAERWTIVNADAP